MPTEPAALVDDLAVPLTFTLPSGWTQLDPETHGAPGSAMLALHDERGETFTPSITIGIARRQDRATLAEVAEEAVRRLAAVSEQVEVVSRRDVSEGEAPGITQTLLLTTALGGTRQELVQSQVHIEVPLVPPTPGEVPSDRLAIELTGTCRREQAGTILRDFQTFVDSVKVEVRPRSQTPFADGEPSPPEGDRP